MAFSALKEISAAAATSPSNYLVRGNERNLLQNPARTYYADTTDISYAPTFLAELLKHNAAEIHSEEITAFSQIAKNIDAAHKAADALLDVTAGRDENFIRTLGDHKLALKSLNNAYANHERINSQYKTLLTRAERARAAKDQVELDQIQELILTTLKEREVAENTLFNAFEAVGELGKTNQVKNNNIKGARTALNGKTNGALTTEEQTNLRKYSNDIFGLSNIDLSSADGAEQVHKLLDKNEANIRTLLDSTSHKIGFNTWNLICTTDTSGDWTRSRIENRRRNEKDLQNQIEQNSALRNELKLEMARSKEESSHAETSLNRAIERTNGSLTDIALIEKRGDLNKKAENIGNAHNQISDLISQVENLQNDITTNTTGGVINWDAISTDGSSKTLKAKLIEINNAYGRVRTSQEKQTGNIFDSLGGFNNLIENLDTDTGGVAKTSDTIWAGLQSGMTHVETNASLLGEEANTVLGDLIVIDSKIFEHCHNLFIDQNIYHNNLIQEKRQIDALNLNSLLSSGQTSGYVFDIYSALLPFAPTGTPPGTPHTIPATDPQVTIFKDKLRSFVNYVNEELKASNISDTHRSKLEAFAMTAESIINSNNTVDHTISSKLEEDIRGFVNSTRGRSDEIGDTTSGTSNENGTLIEQSNYHKDRLNKLLDKNKGLRNVTEIHNDAKYKEKSLSLFRTALDAIDAAQTPADLDAIEAKLKGQLEADMQGKIKTAVDARLEEIKAGADGKGRKDGANGKDGESKGGMPWYAWALGIASFAVGGFGLFSASQAKQSADDQKKKFEATMAQLDQRLGDLQQMTSVSLKNSAVAAQRAGVASKNAQIAQRTAIKTENRVNQIRPFARKSSKKKVGVGS